MGLSLQYENHEIEIFDDPSFKLGIDSPKEYDKVFQLEQDKEYTPTSQHAIQILKNGSRIGSAIILANGGGTCVHSDTAILDNEDLIIRCCNKVFSIKIPGLILNWAIEIDLATCFGIYTYKDTFISHGECSIARFDKTGKVLWSYSGADIFVNPVDRGISFEMQIDHIDLTDFNGSEYKIDYNGHTISYADSDTYKNEHLKISGQSQKHWWKFW